MGIWIKINKEFYNNDAYFYKIETEAYGESSAYIGINPKEKCIMFYDNNLNLLKKLYRYSDDPVGIIPGIPSGVVAYVVIKTMTALDKNEFPDCLDYFA